MKPVRRLQIAVPDFQGVDPIIVFRQATQWLIEHIIYVSTGTLGKGVSAFPRLAPILDRSNEEHAPTTEKVVALLGSMREEVKQLRPPMGDGPMRLNNLTERMQNLDPNDHEGLKDLLEDMTKRFGREEKNTDPWSFEWSPEDDGSKEDED